MKLDPKLQAQLGQMFVSPEGENELTGQLLMLDVAKIQTAAQPRTHFDATSLKDLENSIRELNAAGQGIGGSGILQPLLVRVGEDGTYLVTAGERRLRAAKAAGITQIPVVVTQSGDEDAWEHAIIENIVRADLGPLEEAEAIQKLIKTRGYSVREAAKRLGRDKGYLENRLFLLKAPEDVREMVSARADTLRHAREIARIEEPEARRKLIESAIAGAPFGAIQERVQSVLKLGNSKNDGQKTPVSARADTSVEGSFGETLTSLPATLKALKATARSLPADPEKRARWATQLEKHAGELLKLAGQLKK